MSAHVLVVDDEALARARLRTLLGDCGPDSVVSVTEAAHAQQALECLGARAFDLVLLDIHMPGMDGLALADALRAGTTPLGGPPPALVFVTAHAEHALRAFDLEAVDYLTKPVRLERLRAALQKVQRYKSVVSAETAQNDAEVLRIHDRGRTERVPISDVLYLRAELKYLTVRTVHHSYLLDGALNDLEQRFGERFLRVHRSALVARAALRSLERQPDGDDGEAWVLRLRGVDDRVPVSRRQLALVRAALAA